MRFELTTPTLAINPIARMIARGNFDNLTHLVSIGVFGRFT